MDVAKQIAKQLNLKLTQVNAAIALLDEGSTIPFIARYRKEVTDNLTDSDLRDLSDKLLYLRNLEERMNTVISSITEQGKMTPELHLEIEKVTTLAELEDLYRPYKPKRKTRASMAKERGLEPLAIYLKLGKKDSNTEAYFDSFINEERGVLTRDDAVNGALDIIAEEISDNALYRRYIKKLIFQEGFLTSKEVSKDEKDTFGQYQDYKERVNSIPPHRILAINRGEKLKLLKVALAFDETKIITYIGRDYLLQNSFATLLEGAIKDALKRLVFPSVENEIRQELFEKAEDSSLLIFKKNLSALLLYPPLKNKVILGFDPGFRTGCKYALVNERGMSVEVGVVNLTAGSKNEVERARQEIIQLLTTYKVDYIALGNGTASRESEVELREIIEQHQFDTKLFIVNESGASVYSASKLAEEEFPDLTVEKRSAISLARRVQDPLSELVKIDPKAIGVGQYQHDMNQTKLTAALNGVVEDVVNRVGVGLNNASVALLSYVAGVNKTVAANIVEYNHTNGGFKSRMELRKVKKLGEKAFTQCAGFLRIYDGIEPLDMTAIHPESYDVARYILKMLAIDLKLTPVSEKERLLQGLDKLAIKDKFKIGDATLFDIIEEIKRPGRDVRDDLEMVILNHTVKEMKDLKVGMVLQGTVRNIMDFGMFVDINVHQDGLVHISEVANAFVKDISSLYAINDIVTVKVIALDLAKKRISLSIKQAK